MQVKIGDKIIDSLWEIALGLTYFLAIIISLGKYFTIYDETYYIVIFISIFLVRAYWILSIFFNTSFYEGKL